jgi:hypothetical protein
MSLLFVRLGKNKCGATVSACGWGCTSFVFVEALAFSFFYLSFYLLYVRLTMTANVLRLSEGGDFEALHCQLSTNFDRSTKLD